MEECPRLFRQDGTLCCRLLQGGRCRNYPSFERCVEYQRAEKEKWAGHCLVTSTRMLHIMSAIDAAQGAPLVIHTKGAAEYVEMLGSFCEELRALLGAEHRSVRIADKVIPD